MDAFFNACGHRNFVRNEDERFCFVRGRRFESSKLVQNFQLYEGKLTTHISSATKTRLTNVQQDKS